MVKIYIGSADNTSRPYSSDDPLGEQPLDNWTLVASGKDHKEALDELIEATNNEDINIDNSWLRIVEEK